MGPPRGVTCARRLARPMRTTGRRTPRQPAHPPNRRRKVGPIGQALSRESLVRPAEAPPASYTDALAVAYRTPLDCGAYGGRSDAVPTTPRRANRARRPAPVPVLPRRKSPPSCWNTLTRSASSARYAPPSTWPAPDEQTHPRQRSRSGLSRPANRPTRKAQQADQVPPSQPPPDTPGHSWQRLTLRPMAGPMPSLAPHSVLHLGYEGDRQRRARDRGADPGLG